MSEPQLAIRVSDNGIITPGCVISSKFAIIQVNSKKVDSKFLTYLLNSQLFKKELKKINEGIVKQIKISDLNKLELSIPSIDEQNQVVEYLELLDEDIELQEKLIKENKNLKEGMIQLICQQ